MCLLHVGRLVSFALVATQRFAKPSNLMESALSTYTRLNYNDYASSQLNLDCSMMLYVVLWQENAR